MHQSIGKKNRVAIYLILLCLLSTTTGKFLEPQNKLSLKINKIEVAGLTNIENLKIKNDLNNIFYQNILTLGKEKINGIINKHNIIEEYNIKKIYPSTIYIEIKPVKFLAMMTGNNRLIVGSNGKLIPNEKSNKTLPLIYGKFNSKEFLKFKKSVDQSKFNFTEFKTLYFFPSNRWDILTINDILIKLPQVNTSESLNMAYKIISSIQFEDKEIIDLRIKNHLIIK